MYDVSVVIITYGHEKYIRQALDSVLMQKVDFEYEIIIGEDKSPDNTREILLEYKKKYNDRITLVLRNTNIGATQNLYDILLKCKGRYIALLEGDDYWIDAKKLQKQKDFLDLNTDFTAVSHAIEGRDINNNAIGEYPNKRLRNREITMGDFLRGDTFGSNSLMYRNFFLDTDKNYRVITANRMVGDMTICILLLDKGKIFILDEIMGVYRIRNNKEDKNYNSMFDWSQKYRDSIEVINANVEYFKGKYNLFYFFFQFSAIALLWSIKRKELSKFKKIFDLGPIEYKKRFFIYLPLWLPKIIYQKLIRVIRAR